MPRDEKLTPTLPDTPTLLDKEKAIEAARQSIAANNMAEWPQCVLLKNPQLVVQHPFLVQDRGDEDSEISKYTWVVPYGIEGDKNEDSVPFARLCILVDGATGEFEEVTVFGKPVPYLAKAKAVEVVATALHLQDLILVTGSELMFEPSEITTSRAYPFWKMVVARREYFVDQAGKFYDHISKGKGGS